MTSSVQNAPSVVAELTAGTGPQGIERVVDLDELAARCTALRNRGLRIAHCHGCFDLMHPGHIKHFEAAKRFADVLVVTVTPDRFVQKGSNRPAFPEELRAYCIGSLACVDLVAINRWPTAVETIGLLRPTYFVKGQEFETLEDPTGKLQQEVDAVHAAGGQMRFTREQVFSSTALLGEHLGLEDRRHEDRPPATTATRARVAASPLDPSEIEAQLQALAGLEVCVIGDSIIDEYHHCEPMGTASKSSVVAHRRRDAEAHAGGSLAIANHMAEVCARVHLISVLGALDSREAFLRDRLSTKVEARFFHRPDATSVVKRRYLSRQTRQKLFEVNSLPSAPLTGAVTRDIIGYLEQVLPRFDLVLVADYGHDFISAEIIEVIARQARCMVVNAQTNSANAGFNLITRYPRADIVCLDEAEARLAVGSRDGDIDAVARTLAARLDSRAFVVTLGARGCLAVDGDGEILRAELPAQTQLVDAIGAGDALLSYCTPAIAAGLPLAAALRLGNAAGALAVQIVGNRRPVRRQELIDYLSAAPCAAETAASAPAAPASAPIQATAVPRLAAMSVANATALADRIEINDSSDYPKAYYRDLLARVRRVGVTDGEGRALDFTTGVLRASAAIAELRGSGRKVMFIGNGASAAIASHMAADFAKNGGVRALAFNDAALLTAVSNDTSFEQVFEAPVRLFAEPGDILLAISSSGRSPNILRAAQAARELGCRLMTLSGFDADNPLRGMGELNLHVPCLSYGVTEVLHHSLCHCILDTYMIQHIGSLP
jgi:cytidyltransferase-like protein